MDELSDLKEHAIPEGRLNLESSHSNLERVAAYCEANYVQASDKQQALEETKKYTIQSLASVAYQINTLASNLLNMLDTQADKLCDLENQVHNISQIVDIHKEKVARRETGVLTTNRVVPKIHKINMPSYQKSNSRYVRRSIDYSQLDHIGHGVRSAHDQRDQIMINRTASTVSATSSASANSNTMPLHGYPAQYGGHANEPIYQSGARIQAKSILRGPVMASQEQHYRAPVTATMPAIPSEYGSLPHGGQQYARNQSIGGGPNGNYSAVGVGPPYNPGTGAIQLEMPPQIGYRQSGRSSYDSDLPPPPMDFFDPQQESPPLPPPPALLMEGELTPTGNSDGYNFDAPHDGQQYGDDHVVPAHYISKTYALFDYAAERADELSFRENSTIYVLKMNEDGWYEGVNNGLTGLFPGNYVAEI